jgi:hypothetical protein
MPFSLCRQKKHDMKKTYFLALLVNFFPLILVAQTRLETNGSPDFVLANTNALNTGVTSRMFFKSGSYYSGGIATIGTNMTNARLSFFTNTSVDHNNLLERLTILHNGYVGVANTNPQYPIHLKSGGIGFTQESNSGDAKVGFYTNSTSAYVQTHNDVPLRFATNNASTQMILTTAGRLGIGTATPVSKLDVKGMTTITQQAGEAAALQINGGIKVGGANPAAFRVTATNNLNIQIDHPACNNNPDAMILVMSVQGDSDDPVVEGVYRVKYSEVYNKWYIYPSGYTTSELHYNTLIKLCDNSCPSYNLAETEEHQLPIGAKFNVLIINN